MTFLNCLKASLSQFDIFLCLYLPRPLRTWWRFYFFRKEEFHVCYGLDEGHYAHLYQKDFSGKATCEYRVRLNARRAWAHRLEGY